MSAAPPPASGPNAPEPVVPDYGLQISAALHRIIQQKPATGLTLGYIIDSAGERAFGVLMAFLCLPFLVPLIPGVSVPFGAAIMLLGAQLALGWHKPWLPRRARNWHLPDKFTSKLLTGMAKVFKPLEKIFRPRLAFMQNRAAYIAIGLALIVDGLILALPLPIPGTNAPPAWMAMIIILGITEEDGVMMLVGLVITALATAAVIVIFVFSYEKYEDHKNHRPAHPPATATAPGSTSASLPSSASSPAP